MRNIALTVAYEGTNYHGWQCQPGVVTVQEVLRQATGRVVDHPVTLYAGARTDAGVHAFGQVAGFHTEKHIPAYNLIKGVNSLLPRDVRVLSARDEAPDFHARYSAKSKTYVYTILNRPHNSPFYARYAWHIWYPIEVSAMERAARLIRGEHDFASFKKKDEPYESTVRRVLRAGVTRRGDLIFFVVEATGFLRYMVRNLVGTLVLVGSGKLSTAGFEEILRARDREKAGPTAPPQGLFLRRIRYEGEWVDEGVRGWE